MKHTHSLLAGAGMLLVATVAAWTTIAHADTPVAWGTPLAGGPVRAVALLAPEAGADLNGLGLRLEMETIALDTKSLATLGGKERDRLLKAISRSEVVILDASAAAILPPEVAEATAARVREGGGLLVARHGRAATQPLPRALQELADTMEPEYPAMPVTGGVGAVLTPEWQEGVDFVRFGKSGNGRVALIDFPEGEPEGGLFLLPALRHPLLAESQHFESYYSMAARVVFWAAGRTPGAWVAGVETVEQPRPDPSEIPPFLPEEFIAQQQELTNTSGYRSFEMLLDGPAENDYQVVSQMRQPGRDWVENVTYPGLLRKGDDRFQVYSAAGPGRYFLDLWILDNKGRVVSWHTEPVTVGGWPDLSAVTASKGAVYPNDSLRVSARIEAPVSGTVSVMEGSLRPPAGLMVRAIDPAGRLVAEAIRQAPAGGGQVEVELGLTDLLSRQIRVEMHALTLDSPEPHPVSLYQAAYRHLYLPVARPADGPVMQAVVRTGAAGARGDRALFRALAALGASAAYGPAEEGFGFAAASAGLMPVYEACNLVPETVLDGVARVPDLASDTWLEGEAERVAAVVGSMWGADSAAFSLGDGNCLATGGENVCQSPASLILFRAWLRERYPDLDTLNRVWQTAFASWDDVTPAPEDAARALKVYPPWLEFRLFMDTQFASAQRKLADAARSAWPDARAGWIARGGENPALGYDWSLLATGNMFHVIPPDPLLAARVRAHTGDSRRGGFCVWRGDSPPGHDGAAWVAWAALLAGFPSVWWGEGPEGGRPVLDSTGAPAPDFLALMTELNRINTGAGAMLASAMRLPSPVALLDSQPSRYLAHVSPHDGDSDRAVYALMQDLGWPVDVLPAERLLSDGPGPVRLILLPAALALSQEEADALRRFVGEGGHLLAGILPGEHTAQGLRREQSPLADLFPVNPPEGNAVAVSEHGEARAILLGPTFRAYASAEKGEDRKSRESLQKALDALEIARPVPLRADSNMHLAMTAAYTAGDARIFALLPHPGESANVLLDLKGVDAAYDLLTGARLPASGGLRVKSIPGEPVLVAVHPEPVAPPALDTPGQAEAGKRLPLYVSTGTTGDGMAVVTVSAGGMPDFQKPAPPVPLRHYTRAVLCPGGQGESYIPFALNDPPGPYTLRVTDALTGQSTERIIDLVQRQRPVQ